MSRPSIEEVLADSANDAFGEFCADTGCIPDCFTIHGPRTTRMSAEFRRGNFIHWVTDRVAAACEDGPLIDHDRGVAVIRLDPELAEELRWGAGHLAPSEVTMTPPPRGSLRWAAALMDRAARIVGGDRP